LFKAWVEVRDPRRTLPLGRGGEVLLCGPCGEGPTGGVLACFAGAPSRYVEDSWYRAKIGPAVLA
jgi:hypothetical protein